jgi:hypothetical protein
LIGYDRGDAPWIAYESQPGAPGNEIGVLTRSGHDHEWSLVPVSSKAPSNLVGAYLPPSEDSDRERIALAWAEKTDSGYDIKTAVLDLARRKLRSERTVASGIQARTPPLPSIAVSHDGKRATLGVMSAETHQGWTGGFASGEFENLREYPAAAAGQGVTGFPQAFYLPCGDSAELLVGVGAPPTPWGTPDLGKDLRIEALSASR